MIIDPIGDLLSRIRNGQLRRKAKISSPNSYLNAAIAVIFCLTSITRSSKNGSPPPLTPMTFYWSCPKFCRSFMSNGMPVQNLDR